MRAFVAVDAPGSAALVSLQTEIISATGWNQRDAKPVEAQNFHFTMIFLGEITDADRARVESGLASVNFEPFPLSYSKVGAFPRLDAARIVWAGVDEAAGRRLAHLAEKVHSALSPAGFKPDKPFSPHLTIFRIKTDRRADITAISRKYEAGRIAGGMIDSVHLKMSELKSSGPVYSNVYTVGAKK
ncbi:MAG TPA: RNA 2',3'-cyclic phosphodiesterase [Nitrososphaera sp.]|jgi:2'-5' RNA ligase